YAYSPARDVGFVILLNGRFAPEALDRIASLATLYLKADVEPPVPPAFASEPQFLDRFAGYYHDSSPRNQVLGFVTWLLNGQTISVEGNHLMSRPILGRAQPLVPVVVGLFPPPSEVDATRVFATDEDEQLVLTGAGYAVRQPRWRVELVRVPVVACSIILLSPLIVAIGWVAHSKWARP